MVIGKYQSSHQSQPCDPEIQGKMTHLQRRAWNVLLANAYNELPDKDIHSVSVAELAAKLGFDSKNEEYLKDMLKSLRNCEVEWNILRKDKKHLKHTDF